MDDPDNWRWVWLVAALAFGLGEMATPGSFFLAPFGIGAALAAIASFAGIGIGATWLVFVAGSAVAAAALRPLARRLDQDTVDPPGAGASRLLGEQGLVLDPVPPGPDELGLVRVGREEWRAQSSDGAAIGAGVTITVVEVRGTRLVVTAHGATIPRHPPERSI